MMSTQPKALKEVVVAVSLGGTKLAVALVGSEGPIKDPPSKEADWRNEFDIVYGPADQNNEPLREKAEKKLIAGMVDWTYSAFTEAGEEELCIRKFGVATKGPIRKSCENGQNYVIVGPCTTLPFKECRLDRELARALRKLGVPAPVVEVVHDGAAAALGEMKYSACKSGSSGYSPSTAAGTTENMENMAAVIIGTGVGVGVIEDGKVYDGIDPDTMGNAYERNIGSLGRHLVCVRRQESRVSGHWPEFCCYQYRGAHPGSKYAPICKGSGEVYFTERVAGPWLAKEIARLLNQYSQENAQQALYTLSKMLVTAADLDRLLSLDREDKESKALQKKILVGLTQAAQLEDDWSRYQIGAIGAEIGAALAEFILAFRDREFVKNIILVSTVSENLGDGVAVNRTCPFEKNVNDSLITRVRVAAEAGLSGNGVPEAEARQLANGIVRSLLGGERELWAFMP